MDGFVKWFNSRKGYGMIQGDDDINYFFHYTDISRGAVILDNNRVMFDPASVRGRKLARNVIPI